MKKILIIGLGFLTFACTESNTTADEADAEVTTTDETRTTDETVGDGDVEIGSGKEISPQLEGLEDTGRLEVDTLSSATEEQQRQQNQKKQ
ncbi:hypothetical protein H7F15_11325 [Pontibacter sp. Tf4]|uniref:hypothetical protein n=1 Tax=Pontibacter sp. Tf4 TaxID=2761620 RepID=UPI00162745BC|nr:hypothetical protein [Pontibacter sp. Tf4]MBB6611630.1 hypothetical protein [Pontibacter sp. Tf4]